MCVNVLGLDKKLWEDEVYKFARKHQLEVQWKYLQISLRHNLKAWFCESRWGFQVGVGGRRWPYIKQLLNRYDPTTQYSYKLFSAPTTIVGSYNPLRQSKTL